MLILVAAATLSFMIFFPLVVATSVFKVLDEKQSSKFLRIFFPKYYLYGFVLSLAGVILSIYFENILSILVYSFIKVFFYKFSIKFIYWHLAEPGASEKRPLEGALGREGFSMIIISPWKEMIDHMSLQDQIPFHHRSLFC